MKAISLWQPWASAIPAGLKTIETRSWSTNYRGPLAIHAAKRWTREENEFWLEQTVRGGTPDGWKAFLELGIQNADDLPLGCIVATCELADCMSTDVDPFRNIPSRHRISLSEWRWGNYDFGRFAWLLTDIKPLDKPVPFKGAQGFFDWTP